MARTFAVNRSAWCRTPKVAEWIPLLPSGPQRFDRGERYFARYGYSGNSEKRLETSCSGVDMNPSLFSLATRTPESYGAQSRNPDLRVPKSALQPDAAKAV